MRCRYLLVFGVFASVLAQGCMSERKSGVPMVNDIGSDVSTRRRYRLSCVYEGEKSEKINVRVDLLEGCCPNVFSRNGLPIVLRIKYNKFESFDAWTVLLSLCTLSIVPEVTHWETTFNCSVELANESDGKATFELVNVFEQACSILVPSGLFVYTGDKVVPGRHVFSENRQYINTGNRIVELSDFARLVQDDVPFRRALAYAIAVKIKEFEDSGKIDVVHDKKAASSPLVPLHSIVSLDRDSDGGYSFVLSMKAGSLNVDAAVRAVLHEFKESIKDDYLDAFPGVESESLSVAIPDYKVEGLNIRGRAVVLTIKPLYLTYNPHTRRGRLSVRFNVGQTEEARAWIRKNIKALARDKNIALVTGQLPPEANYYLFDEKINGNVMEIEFKTE